MVGEGSGGPSKKPRIDNCIDLVENSTDLADLKEQVRKLEEQNEQLRSLEEAMGELRGMVECPVCLQVPRQGGPIPVCSNGHFVCRTCRDRIRQGALLDGMGQAKCPSCMVNLGNATSLLASRLVEKMKHKCEQEGCEQMIPFPQLEKHQMVCLFRKVLCPGNTCKLEIQFNKVEEHAKSCANFSKWIIESNNSSWSQILSGSSMGTIEFVTWPTKTILLHGKVFFVKTKRENQIYTFETMMLGNDEECKEYLSSITILDKDGEIFTRNTSHPRPINMEEWGGMGLMLPENALSRVWTLKEEKPTYGIKISIKKSGDNIN